MIDALDIGYAIKDRRTQLGMTQAQLADAAGISRRCLWSLELGQNPGVQLNKLTAVFAALNLDLTINADPPTDGRTVRPSNACESDTENKPASADGTPAQDDAAANHASNVGFDALAILTGEAT